MYCLRDFVDRNDPILQKGVSALERKRLDLFENVLNDPAFDAGSFTARALLYEAAEQTCIDAFYMLGNRGVSLYDNDQHPSSQKPHALSVHHLPAVSIFLEETPLHVLFRKCNLTSVFDLDLGSYFHAADLIKTFNTVAQKNYTPVLKPSQDSPLSAQSPLDTLWAHYQNQQKFFETHADDQSQTELNLRMAQFLSSCLQFIPDLTIPSLFDKPTLLKNALETADIPCIFVLANPTIAQLNRRKYLFSPKEARFFQTCPFIDEDLKQEMNCPILPIKQTCHSQPVGFWQRLKKNFARQL